MSLPTVAHALNLIETRWKQFSITATTTAATMTPVPLSVTSIARSARVATVTTSAAHGFFVGQYVWIAGATQDAYNGKWLVASSGSTTTFTFEFPDRGQYFIETASLPVTPATGTITVYERYYARRVRIRTAANGADTIGFGPTIAADFHSLAASTEYELPVMPDDSYFDLSTWYVKASANTPSIRVLYN